MNAERRKLEDKFNKIIKNLKDDDGDIGLEIKPNELHSFLNDAMVGWNFKSCPFEPKELRPDILRSIISGVSKFDDVRIDIPKLDERFILDTSFRIIFFTRKEDGKLVEGVLEIRHNPHLLASFFPQFKMLYKLENEINGMR